MKERDKKIDKAFYYNTMLPMDTGFQTTFRREALEPAFNSLNRWTFSSMIFSTDELLHQWYFLCLNFHSSLLEFNVTLEYIGIYVILNINTLITLLLLIIY